MLIEQIKSLRNRLLTQNFAPNQVVYFNFLKKPD